jgi:hypothetical protein
MITQESDREHGAHTAAKAEADNAHYVYVDASQKVAPRPASKDRGVQIAAAKLRLVTDRRLGLETPDWVRELAAEKPHRHGS